MQDCGCALFADDAKLYVRCRRDTVTSIVLNAALQRVHTWSQVWQLPLAIPKCSVFCFGRHNAEPAYTVDGTKLPYAKEIKDLGILLSESTKPSAHCEKVAKKGLQMGAHIFRCFRTRSRDFLKGMFRVFVRPIVSYNSEIFTPYLLKDIRGLERVLRRYTKRFPGMRNLPYATRLRHLNIRSLEECRLRADLIFTFRILNRLVDVRPDNFFELSQNLRTRGNSQKLRIPRCRLDSTKYFFTNRIPAVWNTLPEEVVTARSLCSFKSRLEKVDLTNYIRGFNVT